MPITPDCPSRESLSDYSLGKLSDDSSEVIERHVSVCTDCQEALVRAADDGDPLVSILQRARADDPYQTEFQLHQALSWAEAMERDQTPSGRGDDATGSDAGKPERLGQYELISQLGAGGMGTVYKAMHTRLKKIVAVKVLPSDRTGDADAIARFSREIMAVGKLEHPHIVRAMDANDDEGVHYLVMEYVEGIDLSELSRRLGPLPIADACELVRQAAIGLQHAHEHRLVHRDIKPSNLMLATSPRPSHSHEAGKRGVVKILDLGLALLRGQDEELTTAGQIMGTVDYMAPEQVDSSHDVDIRADIYSLGATLYKLLCGTAPFQGKEFGSFASKVAALVNDPVPSIQERRGGIPDGLVKVLERMLEKDPCRRFAEPAEIADALAPFCDASNLAAALELAAEQLNNPVSQDNSLRSTLPPSPVLRDTTSMLPTPATPAGKAKPRSGQRRVSIRSVMIGLALAGGLCVAGVVIRLATDRGVLVVECSDPNVRITVRRGADYVEEYELRKGPNQITLWSGEYEIKLALESELICVEKELIVLRRGDTETVRIYRTNIDGKPIVAATAVKAGGPPPLAVAPFTAEQAQSHQSQWAEHLGLAAIRENSIGMKLILIPPGEFKMGSPESEVERQELDESPVHRVRVTKPFYLGVYEVTQQEYRQVTGDNPSSFSAAGGSAPLVANLDTNRHPVEQISWDDALRFCEQLAALPDEKRAGGYYRLPTEAEWEYACRAGTTTAFHFGESLSGGQANFDGNAPYLAEDVVPSLGRTEAVGGYEPNAFGLCDMHGNVWEWCEDLYASTYYPRSIVDDPPGARYGSGHALRGGGWREPGRNCRAANRSPSSSNSKSWVAGTRVVWVPPLRNWDSLHSGKPERVTNTIGMTLVSIPAGEFEMGSPESERAATLGRTAQVGSYYVNRFGLYDMHGNVREYCSDWYNKGYYADSPEVDPQGPAAGKFRVVKGGDCENDARRARSAYHGAATPLKRSPSLGMRLVCEIADPDDGESAATVVNSVGATLKLIPAGEFQMGSPETEEGRDGDEARHLVKITKPFHMSVHEVTQAEFRQVMGVNPSFFSALGGGAEIVRGMETDRFPVEMILWQDAVDYCRRLSALPEEQRAGRRYRLPTEAEWEYACRAGTTSRYHHGNSDSSEFANYRGDDNEGPRHRVRITKPFLMGMYEVTQEQYQRVMRVNPSAHATGGANEGKVNGMRTDHFPVEMVTWSDAAEFCAKLSFLPEELRAGRRYRLPTEAEWEYACRANTTTPFHFGIAVSPRIANVFHGFRFPHTYDYGETIASLGRTCEVGSFPANPFGLHDMHGNVWELCADWYGGDYYRNSPRLDPPGPPMGSTRIIRGGSFKSVSTAHAANRSAVREDESYESWGFRVVCDVEH